jgi:AI-2 transport protein TqsA
MAATPPYAAASAPWEDSMTETAENTAPANDGTAAPAGPGPARSWAVLHWLLVMATAWFLLKELAPILRPLLLAIFLAYVILPMGVYVRGQVRGGYSHLAVLFGLCLAFAALALLTYGDVVGLAREVPHLHEKSKEMLGDASEYIKQYVPQFGSALDETAKAEAVGSTRLQQTLEGLANATVGVLVEAIQVAFFLFLIILEARRFPQRLQNAFAGGNAERVFSMVANINTAIASYLKAKVKVNIVLAVPAMLTLWAFGIRFVIFWGALTFLANFVPYLGSIVACGTPILFGFIDLGFTWQALAGAIVLIGVHATCAYVIEPAMTGKAVDLSPLVVLISLSFWGLCWGVVGMVLAVPLTAMLKIALESTPSTRPIARLMGSE